MDTLISDSPGQASSVASRELIGWWCLFDASEVWEWGRAMLTDVYRHPLYARSSHKAAFLQQAANH